MEHKYKNFWKKQRGTDMYYGLEFRSIKKLQKLLKCQKNWEHLNTFLCSGTDTTFLLVDISIIKNDWETNIKRGNYKSFSKSNEEIQFVKKQYSKEVTKQWMIWLPVNIIQQLKNACVIPIGVVS